VLGIDPSLIMGYAETTLLFSWKLPTFAVSCRCHANGDEWRQMVTKTEKRSESELAPFDQNLLITLDLSRLRHNCD
jgi:hypothetical protein